MKTLMLCRHAKSSWKYDTEDLYRPLNARGIRQAPLMAENKEFQPDLVLCSPAVRAWSTAVCYFNECGWDYSVLQMNPNLHEVAANILINELRKIPEYVSKTPINMVVLFGHNPGLNDLISFLDAGDHLHPNLVTSGRVMLQLDIKCWQDLAESCGKITDWLTPADISPVDMIDTDLASN